jgi:hypothetical protein
MFHFFDNKIQDVTLRVEANGDVYFGSVKSSVKQGKAKLVFANPTDEFKSMYFVGTFENGIRTNGKLCCADGVSYEGEFQNEVPQGRGRYKSKECEYEGEFLNFKWHGKGTVKYSNGKMHTGQFQEQIKHGIGKSTDPDGLNVWGEWKNDQLNGFGISHLPSKFLAGVSYPEEVSFGHYENDKKNFIGIYIFQK